MPNKAKLIFFLICLLFLFFISGFSSVGGHSLVHNQKVESVLKNTFPDLHEEVVGLRGILHSSRLSENFYPSFKTSKNYKRFFKCFPFAISFAFSTSSTYCFDKNNKFNSCSPYIAYCCLTI